MDIVSQLQAARITNPMQAQAFPFVLYDSLLIGTVVPTQLSFFQTPVGAGVSSAIAAPPGTAKTYADTNMNLAGQLPSGMEFLIKSIELVYEPGRQNIIQQFIPAPAMAGLSPTDYSLVNDAIEDVNTIMSAGWLELNILQQNYVRDAPLSVFPPKTRKTLDGTALAIDTSANTGAAGLLRADGRPWYLDGEGLPGITLQPATNFEVLVKFPAAPVVANIGRMRVRLDGYVVRASQ